MMVCKQKGLSSGFTWLLADIHTLLQNTLHTGLTFFPRCVRRRFQDVLKMDGVLNWEETKVGGLSSAHKPVWAAWDIH